MSIRPMRSNSLNTEPVIGQPEMTKKTSTPDISTGQDVRPDMVDQNSQHRHDAKALDLWYKVMLREEHILSL
jgi:hypothetical protein